MTKLDSIFKSRDITLSIKVHLVQAMVFPVVMYGCESWTIKSWAPKNWCFWTVVLEKTLESPLNCKEISPGCPLEGLMLKLKLQYFGHLMLRADSLEKTLMLGKIEGRRRREWQRMASLTQYTWVWVDSRSWWWTGKPGVLRFMGLWRIGPDWATELNWPGNQKLFLPLAPFLFKLIQAQNHWYFPFKSSITNHSPRSDLSSSTT